MIKVTSLKRKPWSILIVVLIVVCLFCLGIQKDKENVQVSVNIDSKIEQILHNSLGCLKQLFTDDWEAGSYKQLSQLATRCTSKLFYSLPVLRLGNPAFESKYFLPPKDHFDRCTIVTLGVGREIFAETELRKNLPQCTFLGADPDESTNRKLFEQELYGVFVKTAVGGKTGEYVGNFLSNFGLFQAYFPKKTEHLGLQKFLMDHNGMDQTVDLLLVDVEGAEFGIFDALIRDYDQLPTICQLNAEIHTPADKDANKPYVVDQLYQLMLKSNFIPLKIDTAPFGFYRVFWFNYGNPICVEKYLGMKKQINMDHQTIVPPAPMF